MERLQKILSQAGIASRRASEQLMRDGRVTVNGDTIRELGSKADASRDDIRVDGRRIKVAAHHRYLLLNKPRGYMTTRSDPEDRGETARSKGAAHRLDQAEAAWRGSASARAHCQSHRAA